MAADERIWSVGPEQAQNEETGEILIVGQEVDEERLAHELLKLVGILQRLGGGVSMIARRAHDPVTGLYFTERVDIGWKPHAPLPRRRRQDEPAPEVALDEGGDSEREPEVEPAPAG